jgi:hypothetical protein
MVRRHHREIEELPTEWRVVLDVGNVGVDEGQILLLADLLRCEVEGSDD